jgi:hypothetical protein
MRNTVLIVIREPLESVIPAEAGIQRFVEHAFVVVSLLRNGSFV